MEPDPTMFLLFLLVGFLAGSVPFGLLLVKLAGKGDVRSVGSGNIGATNAARAGGKWLGVLTLALDAAKGFLPVFFARLCFAADDGPLSLRPDAIAAFVALAAVLGHMFTPWLRFRGGKGVATSLGAALAFGSWTLWMLLPPLGVFIVTVALTRYVSLGSMLAALALPLSLLAGLLANHIWTAGSMLFLAPWQTIALLVILKHGPNIARLRSGTENPLWGAKRTKAEGAGSDE